MGSGDMLRKIRDELGHHHLGRAYHGVLMRVVDRVMFWTCEKISRTAQRGSAIHA